MKILLVNDDGIDAKGMLTLIKRLHAEHELLVCAPDGQRSGYSHSITYLKPVKVYKRKIEGFEDIRAYAVAGSPADCVKLATLALFKDEKIDMVISGINDSSNLGRDICYSGTCGAAMEAAASGIRGVAISCYTEIKRPAFEYAADFIAEYIKKVDVYKLPVDTIININVPDTVDGKVKGVRLTKQQGRYYDERYDISASGDEMTCRLVYEDKLPLQEETDVKAIAEGYISITPLKFMRMDDCGFKT